MFCETLRCEKKLTYHEKGNSLEDEIWAGEFSLVNTLFEQARFSMNHLQVFLFNFKNKADKFKNKKEPKNIYLRKVHPEYPGAESQHFYQQFLKNQVCLKVVPEEEEVEAEQKI